MLEAPTLSASILLEDEIDLLPTAATAPLFAVTSFSLTEGTSQGHLIRVRVLAAADDLDVLALLGRGATLSVSRPLGGQEEMRIRDFRGVVRSAQQRGRHRISRERALYSYWLDIRSAPASPSVPPPGRSHAPRARPRGAFLDVDAGSPDAALARRLRTGDQEDGVCGSAACLGDTTVLRYVEPEDYAPGADFLVKDFVSKGFHRDEETASTTHHLGEPLRPPEEGAGLGVETTACQQLYFFGHSDCFELCPGSVFHLADHFRASYNTADTEGAGYLVTRVDHECSLPLPGEEWDPDRHGYAAEFVAVDADIAHRAAKQMPEPRTAATATASCDPDPRLDRPGVRFEVRNGLPRAAAPHQVAAPPPVDDTLGEVSGNAYSSVTESWARIYLSCSDERSYLRLGSVPSDEASIQVGTMEGETLGGYPGLLDYTEGDHVSGTGQDRLEVVSGSWKGVVGGNSDLDEPAHQLRIEQGDQEIAIEDGDQSTTVSGNRKVEVTGGDTTVVHGHQDITVHGTQKITILGSGNLEFCTGATARISMATTDVYLAHVFSAGMRVSAIASFDIYLSGLRIELNGFKTERGTARVVSYTFDTIVNQIQIVGRQLACLGDDFISCSAVVGAIRAVVGVSNHDVKTHMKNVELKQVKFSAFAGPLIISE